jgi:hypothetical protein
MTAERGPLKYTTAVPVSRTVAEVQEMLVAHGADAVGLRYSDGQPVGIQFTLATPQGAQAYALPVEVDAVHKLLIQHVEAGGIRGGMSRATASSRPHAARVAWRVLRQWLEAQLAMIEAQMVRLDQVMLPYMIADRTGRTLYELYRERGMRAIESGTD